MGKKTVWDWFGDHGVFLGAFCLMTVSGSVRMTHPDTTPFSAMYYAPATPDFLFPVVGVTLKPAEERKGRIKDYSEIIPHAATQGELVVFVLVDPESAPEVSTTMRTEDFIAAFVPYCEQWV